MPHQLVYEGDKRLHPSQKFDPGHRRHIKIFEVIRVSCKATDAFIEANQLQRTFTQNRLANHRKAALPKLGARITAMSIWADYKPAMPRFHEADLIADPNSPRDNSSLN
jgi:hypothetical protein